MNFIKIENSSFITEDMHTMVDSPSKKYTFLILNNEFIMIAIVIEIKSNFLLLFAISYKIFLRCFWPVVHSAGLTINELKGLLFDKSQFH